jgi:hypothetical protein
MLGVSISKGSESMADQSFDAASMARDQRRMAASAAIGLNALKPMLQFQVSLLRLWADNIEALAQNYEENYQKGLDTVSSAVEHHRQQQRAA